MIISSFQCDQCNVVRRESNQWITIAKSKDGWYYFHKGCDANDIKLKEVSAKHFCGVACAIGFLNLIIGEVMNGSTTSSST